MKEMLHQVWLGNAMPDDFRRWTGSARRWAEAMGMEYRLWGEKELWRTFGHEPELDTLRTCMETLPTATSYSFASDYFRMRLVAEFGGLYLDADTNCQALTELPKEAGLYCSVERYNPNLWSTWLLWAPGEGGKAAARALWTAARAYFNEMLPPGAPDIPSRYIWQVRRDMPRHGAGNMGLGPAVFRRTLLPQLLAGGWHVAALPAEVASCRNRRAALMQCNAWSWKEPTADWNERARKAKCQERMQGAPIWLRPQGCTMLPEPIAAQQGAGCGVAVRNGWPAPLRLPSGTRRVVVLSNVTRGFSLSGLNLGKGDVCIHCNHARHAAEAMEVEGTRHFLFVRHGKGNDPRGWHWYHEGGFDGFERVLFVDDAAMLSPMQWYGEWKKISRKSPTTGFIAANMVRELYPKVELVLAGFDPGVQHGTTMWKGHDWASEARWYGQRGFTLIRPGK